MPFKDTDRQILVDHSATEYVCTNTSKKLRLVKNVFARVRRETAQTYSEFSRVALFLCVNEVFLLGLAKT